MLSAQEPRPPLGQVNELEPYITTLVDRQYGGVNQRLADAIGLSLSAFLRGMRSGTFATETCLRLAREVGESPSKVLHLAGKGDVAKLIEGLYGAPSKATSDVDRRLLSLQPRQKRMLADLIDDVRR